MPITVSGTSIVFNDSTTQTTAFTGSGGVTSLNGQTGAITNTSTNTIGSYAVGYVLSEGATYSFNTTVSGSSIRMSQNQNSLWYADANPFGGSNSADSHFNPSLSGTWRAMSYSKNGNRNPDDPGNPAYSAKPNLWVRIS
jgi:hypothetical protein